MTGRQLKIQKDSKTGHYSPGVAQGSGAEPRERKDFFFWESSKGAIDPKFR